MHRSLILSLPLLVLATTRVVAQGFAQDTTDHFGLELQLGYGSIASYDNFGSPLAYSGITYPIGGTIEYVTPEVRHLLSGTGITSLGNAKNLTNRYSAQEENNITFAFYELRYRFTQIVSRIGTSGVELSLGGELDNLGFGRLYNYTGNLGSASGSGEASLSAAAAADFTYSFGAGNRARASLSLPLLAMVWRPAYGLISGNATLFSYPVQTRLEPIGTMWSWRIGFAYDYAISRPFLLGLRFHELYYNYPMLAWSAVGAESDLELAITWRFDL